MSEQNININMGLKDNFTPALQRVSESINSVGQSLDKVGRNMSQFGTKMTFLGTAMTGGLVLAMNNVRTISPQVDRSLQDIENAAKSLELTIATALVPVVQKFTTIISNVVDWFNKLNPQLRDSIIQWTLIGGVVLAVGGVFLKVGGTIVSIVGKILAGLNPVTLAIGLIVGALVLMLQYWDKIRAFVMPVVNGLQVAVDMVAIGFLKVVDAVVSLAERFSEFIPTLKIFINILELAGTIPKGMADVWRVQLDRIQNDFAGTRAALAEQISGLEDDMTNAMSGNGWGEALDLTVENLKLGIQSVMDMFNGISFDQAKASLVDFGIKFNEVFGAAYKQAMDLGTQSAQILTNTMTSLSQGIGNAVGNMLVYGKNFGESMKQVFMQMAAQFISSVVSMISQWVIFQAVNASFLPVIVAQASAAASALAALWTVPATLVSIATLGGATAPAMASIATALAGAKAMSAVGMAIPGLAEGGTTLSAGRVLVGERGPEFLDLPSGARVTPLNKASSTSISIIINSPTFSGDADIDALTEKISKKLAHEADRIR